jgi:23S rRNA (uracil1939-C5)-methyltransferase
VSAGEEIVRIAAKGDGVTADGMHVPGSVPGDVVATDGSLLAGPHHVEPPCRHFGKCGGCQLQHADDEALADFVRDRVVHAAGGQGISIGEVAPPHLSPPKSRRRASLKAINGGGRPLIGFREGGSHRLVDLKHCEILAPELFGMVEPIRGLLASRQGKYAVEIDLALVDGGVDLSLKGLALDGLDQTEAMLDFARKTELKRLSLDQGYGPETLWEPEPVTVTLGGVVVPFPAGAFLQATLDGEAVLTAAAAEWMEGCDVVADLFSGLGTFAFALSANSKVLAAEASRDAYLACKTAAGGSGRPVHALHRDLFRNPLQVQELNRFGGVVLDPPRAGAREQAALLASSDVPRIAYISCNPSSWARDAKQLVDGGYRLAELCPVGQFRWSTHVELASLFLLER